MKEIYTSYLNSPAHWESMGFTRVRVCRWVHKGQEARYDRECASLYPTAKQLADAKHLTNREEWVEIYTDEILGSIDPQELYDSLPDKCVLMCHEKTEDDGTVLCHRRIVADWLESQLGIEVPEWVPPEQKQRIELAQRTQE